jgi:hypothetical protein
LAVKAFSCKDIGYSDIKCESKDKNSRWRIFPEFIQEGKVIFHSAISIKPGSLLTFTIGLMKGKEFFKGSIPIDCIRESYDVNILSAQGSVVGYMRVKV